MIIRTKQTTETQQEPTTDEIPQTWLAERDDIFFRLTAALFTPEFLYGASVLLASYDAD